MTPFESLHPALQHHLVNALGWRRLRPLQEAAILPLTQGQHALLLAPTAGGKTEAGILPVLSRMASESWSGMSVLYVCPIRALLNNLEPRLAMYAGFVGRTVARWHGDILQSARRRILRSPADILLTTPESLEVLLDSRSVDRTALFSGLQAVVVDELHSFAGDDRGWHLLAVLDRIRRISGREQQRIGLSATVGNPQELLDWLAGHCEGTRTVIAMPPTAQASPPDVTLDYVGNLDNAATVISRLHRGEKRLVFCDSRSRVESLAENLRAQGVSTHVSHSSLSLEERRQAEQAFAEGTNCVIVATSTLELGLDVGDLDRVIQIDAPATVASFLQRMGRTGRRSGTQRNCLFLATDDDSLLRAAAILRLALLGYVEPVCPPPLPLHLFAQQVMGLLLQEGALVRSEISHWLLRLPCFGLVPKAELDAVIDHMLDKHILFADGGILSFGPEGERQFGFRHFAELFSIFQSPPLFQVLHGRSEVGYVHQTSFQVRNQGTPVLLLGGRGWLVKFVDWKRRIAYVEPSAERGRSRWLGQSPPLHFKLCQAMREVLLSEPMLGQRTKRATEQLATVQSSFAWLTGAETALVHDAHGKTMWWTFAGQLANAALAETLRGAGSARVSNLALAFDGRVSAESLTQELAAHSEASYRPEFSEDAIEGLKFQQCLPAQSIREVLERRLCDKEAIAETLRTPRREVFLAEDTESVSE